MYRNPIERLESHYFTLYVIMVNEVKTTICLYDRMVDSTISKRIRGVILAVAEKDHPEAKVSNEFAINRRYRKIAVTEHMDIYDLYVSINNELDPNVKKD